MFIGHREQRRTSGDKHFAEKRSRRIGIALSASLALPLLFLIPTSLASSASPRRIEVTAKRYGFEPAEITVKKGETVELELTTADVPHGLRIRELKLDVRVSKGKKADARFTPQTTGTFVGHCSVFCGAGHGEMTLTIHVVS